MSRKPTDYTHAFNEGYKKGWDARNLRSILDDPSLWNWADWFAYVLTTLIAVGGVFIIFCLLTMWISWTSDHRSHHNCMMSDPTTTWCMD